MSLLFETIKIDNATICNIGNHNERLNRSRRLSFHANDFVDLKQIITVPKEFRTGIVKCRLLYDIEIRKTEFFRYRPKIIRSLKIIECNNIDYSFKYDDRAKLNELLKRKGDADEILIIKNNLVTDTSFSNIVFYDGRKWITPALPLLKGTKRAELLNKKLIKEAEIKGSDLKYFTKAILINALREFEDKDSVIII